MNNVLLEETAAASPSHGAHRPLRILVAHNVARARTGGMSRIMGFIHDHVEAAGHEVEYFTAEDAGGRLGGRLSRFSFPVLVRRHAARAARAGRAFDVVNVHEPSSAVVAAFKKGAGDPAVVVTSHGVERRGWRLALEELRLGRRGPSLKTRVVYPLTGLSQADAGLRRADHVFCLNYEDRDYLVGELGRAPERVTRIYPAAGEAFSSASRARSYARCRRVLFAATWRKNKGVEDLVPAYAELAARDARLELAVLGAGVPDAEVRAAFPAEVRARVRCVRAETEAETAAAFADADLFVLPSLFEGTPLTLVEAMASGLPVVTTATCGMRDVVRDGENGLLVPTRSPSAIASAVERLVGDESLRARLGSHARAEAAERYRWNLVAAPVLEVYERLCAARGGRV
ncbi:MAG: glycosyltransferase family 4 protein [Pyrinomonadaceae bacterium]